MIDPSQTEFLGSGGAAQQRYEELRSRWMAPDSAGILDIVRMPWGRRLVHFGLLGLLDHDPTGWGWFGVSASEHAARPNGAESAQIRTTRLMLAADDGETRIREAYRWIILSVQTLSAAAGEC